MQIVQKSRKALNCRSAEISGIGGLEILVGTTEFFWGMYSSSEIKPSHEPTGLIGYTLEICES